jgi:hypothetical protein
MHIAEMAVPDTRTEGVAVYSERLSTKNRRPAQPENASKPLSVA